MSNHADLLQTLLLPGVTVLLGIATTALACFTYRMAKSTEKALKQNAQLVAETHELVESNKILVENEERHHQENLRPLCVFSYTGNLHNILRIDRSNNMVIINSDIENKGNGVAKSVKIIFRLGSPRCEGCLQLGPVAAGSKYVNGIEKQHSEIFPLELSCIEAGEIVPTDFFLQQDWVIYIECEDIFNHKFYTIYVKNDNTADIKFSNDPLPSLKDDNILERLAAEIR
ncbi:hypothetical protein [Acidithiobacillus thiooxidans]|uniref:Uncharacterized protein n=1 Tax=Acidithiobacillus thiooxidans ATCC 19377 TaxID=637390 RepID=A0A543Q495_ACITH|nr:hypothetical protein [Acidithiobacillus thiooxidans]MDX5934730.1 hypothetical protein [Acidithiobacillus thiooxidans]TQN51147.1 hypothetical protein DLNHIDIE_01015 [Acidithiobacillus thiooxidans ATCC 19377]